MQWCKMCVADAFALSSKASIMAADGTLVQVSYVRFYITCTTTAALSKLLSRACGFILRYIITWSRAKYEVR